MSHPHAVVAPVLSDGVVTLRPHHDCDEAAVVEQCQDPESVRWTSAPQPYGPEQARAFISAAARGWAQGGNRVWAVEVLDPLTGRPRFAGTLDYRPDGAGAAELGFGLHPAVRGQGLMTRAARLAITYAFDRDGIEVMHWRAYVGNWASRRTAWRSASAWRAPCGSCSSANGSRYDAWIGSLAQGRADGAAPPLARRAGARGRAGAPAALAGGRRAGHRPRRRTIRAAGSSAGSS